MYGSINAYSQEITSDASGSNLSPLAVLRTAIQLHQRNPKPSTSSSTSTDVGASKEAPLVQAELPYKTSEEFHAKLNALKEVLPMATEVKLAALLTAEEGNMNNVVQHILSSGPDGRQMDDSVDEQVSVIDLSADDVDDLDSVSQPIQMTNEEMVEKLSRLPVQADELKKILANATDPPRNENHNLISFHRPSKTTTVQDLSSNEENSNSIKLSQSDNQAIVGRYCSVCMKNVFQFGHFCQFCGSPFKKNVLRW